MHLQASAHNNFNPRSPHGERHSAGTGTSAGTHFNPRSPHGERLWGAGYFCRPPISIHAPRTGSDVRLCTPSELRRTFQSTLPARGATRCIRNHIASYRISIHAPRTGSDLLAVLVGVFPGDVFQSTLPARGATYCQQGFANHCNHFNPRSPHGERRTCRS